MYYIAVAPIGFCTIIVILFFPETFYPRSPIDLPAPEDYTPKKTFTQSLTIFTGIHTRESLFRMFIRPIGLIIIPPILWATLVMSVTIGFLVAVSSNVAPSFQTHYGMQPWQTGLCFVAAIIGSILGIWVGGGFSDRVADYFTKRNGGIREPEFRLPAMMVALITGPLSLIFFGVGINNGIHWIMPTIGLGLVTFTIVQGTNVSFVYILDAYKPIAGAPLGKFNLAGEAVITQLGFKSMFGFLLSFYTNPWVAKLGYSKAYGSMAGISAVVLVLWVPFFVYGKRIRVATHNAKYLQWVKWNLDRESGE
jgi:hypothetical protein